MNLNETIISDILSAFELHKDRIGNECAIAMHINPVKYLLAGLIILILIIDE